MRSQIFPLLLLLFLFSPNSLLFGKTVDPFDGAVKLIDPQHPSSKNKNRFLIENLRLAIKAVQKLSACFDQKTKEKLKEIARELETALQEGRILFQPKAEKMGKSRAYTVKKGKNAKKAVVVFLEEYLFNAATVCSEDFIILLNLVLHEGCHLFQNLKSFPLQGGEKAILEWKISKLSLEAKAYFFAVKIFEQLGKWLNKMRENLIHGLSPMKDLPPCMEIWKKCTSQELTLMLKRLSEERKGINLILYKILKKEYLGKGLAPKQLEEIVKRLRKEMESWKKLGMLQRKITDTMIFQEIQKNAKVAWYLIRQRGPAFPKESRFVRGEPKKEKLPPAKVDLSFTLSSDSGTVEDMKVPEIRFPQDTAILWDNRGHPWLLVVGFNHLSMPSGTVIAIPADKDAIQTSIHKGKIERTLDGFHFLAKKRKVILKNSIFLPHPTSFVMLPENRLHIWDPNRGGVFELTDTTGDHIPDFLDTKNKLPLSKEWKKKVENMAEAEWTGTSLRIYLRALLPLHSYEGPVFYARDENGDGIFEKKALFTPTTLPSRSPIILGEPVPGSDMIYVSGVPIHRIVILSRFQGSPLGDEKISGFGRISKEGVGTVHLSKPALPFESHRAVDLTNGTSSGFYPSSGKIASIGFLSSHEISSRYFQEIVVFGYELWTVREVRIGNVNVPFYRKGNTLHLLVSPQRRKEEYTLKLKLLDGTSITPGYTLDGASE